MVRLRMLFLLVVMSSLLIWMAQAQETSPSEMRISPEEIREGAKIYRRHCLSCHMPEGKSALKRMNLADDEWNHGKALTEIERVIAKGVSGTAMSGFESKLSHRQINLVAKYVWTLSKTLSTETSQPQKRRD